MQTYQRSFLLLTTLLASSCPLPTTQQCGGALPLKTFLFLDKFCEDCYNLYKFEELFTMCRANCYDNDIFYVCLNATLVDKDTQQRAGGFLKQFFKHFHRFLFS